MPRFSAASRGLRVTALGLDLGPRALRLSVLSAVLALVAITGAAPALAQTSAFDARSIDMRPLVQVQGVGATFAGRPFEVDLFIYRGGGAFLVSSVATDLAGRFSTDRVGRGLGDRSEVAGLNGTFLANRILQQTGGCGTPAPDYVEHYTLTYYGQKNNRQITVGGDYRECPAEVREIMDAICLYLWQTIESPIEYCSQPDPT
jgi:hypothetical protein